MKNYYVNLFFLICLFFASPLYAQEAKNIIKISNNTIGLWLIIIMIVMIGGLIIGSLYMKFQKQISENKRWKKEGEKQHFPEYLKNLNKQELNQLFDLKKDKLKINSSEEKKSTTLKFISFLILFLGSSITALAQKEIDQTIPILTRPGIIITIILLIIPIFLGVAYALVKANNTLKNYYNKDRVSEAEKFAEHLYKMNDINSDEELIKKKEALSYNLSNQELSGSVKAEDSKGIINNISDVHQVHFTSVKKKAIPRPALDPGIGKLIVWYLGCATFWLVIGSGIGEYLGIKFVAPDVDHVSWLSFGRLRPVHTNIVFWGWASLGMIGLGYYVVPMVSNAKIFSLKFGWIALVLTNLMVIFGTICLMAGFNNGGGEFREYVWPVMALFAVALILTLANFLLTVAKRTTKEIYISNWYIISAIIFTIIVALTAYLPFWQDGVSETIVQGYFMHSGVGMWFTLFTLGLLYYFIPQQLNIPIYAYSLGILAFWTQILFYTIIGTHHFVFAPLPWWLQTVAIVGSAGMIIPVVAATINFSMTFKGQWHKVNNSYTLPFFLVAVVYYFIVSMQGTAEAFKFTNLVWHFTDFTVAHAHAGFYGIITFAIWGGTYAIVPRLTGKEPPQGIVGVHFWLAFIGLIFYVVPLSIGATLRGLMWMDSKPFIDSVAMMFDYWIWRAIGGSLMFISHLVYAYNFYKMTTKEIEVIDVKTEAFRILEKKTQPIY